MCVHACVYACSGIHINEDENRNENNNLRQYKVNFNIRYQNEQTLNIKEEIKVYECIRTIKGDSFSSEMNKKTNKLNKLGDEKGDS